MALHSKGSSSWLLISLVSLLAAAPALSLNDNDVKKLQQKCEAARSVALEPIRARKTQTCIDQQLRARGHCERYYTTYGNVSPRPGGGAAQGYFYDLPECQAWLDAKDQLRAGRSRY